MADPIILYNVCGKCHGDGQFPNPYTDFYGNLVQPEETVTCPQCNGTGQGPYGFIPATFQEQIDDMQSKIDGTFNKVKQVFNDCKDILKACDDILKLLE